ncbi:hypothetical protein BJX63DRAFT_425847 [Aspergillus granulosus]|uniref:Endonuclease III homolog n=1 Tax=Aspergillus granulosus TaxID=176169 RepID=A0ABR4GUF6_9EURO
MRTSRTSKETAKVLQALSPPARRQTRSSSHAGLFRGFAYNGNANEAEPIKAEDDSSSLSSLDTIDIEDILEPPAKKRKTRASPVVKGSASLRTPKKKIEKTIKTEATPQKTRRAPARKIKSEDGSFTVEPPSNWEAMYSIVKKMRENNPTAPVDTMGCAELHWRASSPRDQRFQTLIALMLSSQTKDTVTAVAMQRLHTELGDGEAPVVKQEAEEGSMIAPPHGKDSTLNLENILAVSPERLNSLIGTVGFHNNKTKYIKKTAEIIRDEYNSDIPPTPAELMKLPGVGPKMAYLCMSAAWGKHEGIGVDVHVHRITNLWGWHKTKTPEETRISLESWLPKDKWHEINKLLVGLGQTVCLPVGKRCGDCDLAGTKLCKSEIKGMAPKNGPRGLPPKEESPTGSFSPVKIKNNFCTVSDSQAIPCTELDAKKTLSSNAESRPVEGVLPAIANAGKPAVTFFDLPEDTKIQILKYAGLLRPCLINFVCEKYRVKTGRGICGYGNPVPMTRVLWTETWVPIQVLQTCHKARTELGALFFAQNYFDIYLYGRAEYKLFCAATQWDLGPRETRYLKSIGSPHRTTWVMWTQFCHNSKEKMPALRLFSMKCKVKDLDIAIRLIRTMEPFPLLAQCAFHFDTKQNNDIRPVIREAAWRLTGNLDEKPPFPWTKLPKEVQLIILEHRTTAMVAFLDRKLPRRTSSPLNCCGTCSPLRAMCFCEARQTAFSTTFSRAFYEDCRREDPEYIMRFLNTIPTSSFMQIRHLSFKFPKSWRRFHGSARTEKIALLSWSVLRRFIREHFDIARLSLSIVDLGTIEPNAEFSELQGLREFQLERAVSGRVSVGRYRPYNMSTPQQHL